MFRVDTISASSFLFITSNANALSKLGRMPTGGGPRLDRRARIQFRRVHFDVLSTPRIVPPALSSDWTSPALSSVRHQWSSVVHHPSSILCRPSSIIHHLLSVIRYPLSTIRRPTSFMEIIIWWRNMTNRQKDKRHISIIYRSLLWLLSSLLS